MQQKWGKEKKQVQDMYKAKPYAEFCHPTIKKYIRLNPVQALTELILICLFQVMSHCRCFCVIVTLNLQCYVRFVGFYRKYNTELSKTCAHQNSRCVLYQF